MTRTATQQYFLTVGAELQESLTRRTLLRQLENLGCQDVAIYRRRPYVLVAEFLVRAHSLREARRVVGRAVERTIPGARQMDIELLGNSHIQALEESTRFELTDKNSRRRAPRSFSKTHEVPDRYELAEPTAIRQLRAQFHKRELTHIELKEILRSHAVAAGLLDESEHLSMLVVDLTERTAEMCASVADLGGDGDAMFAALRTAEGILTSQEMLFAKFVVARCVAIALTHRRGDEDEDEDEVGVAIRAGLCCVPELVSLDNRRRPR